MAMLLRHWHHVLAACDGELEQALAVWRVTWEGL
jgi:hypothetical protein